jgi:hypothetical protein
MVFVERVDTANRDAIRNVRTLRSAGAVPERARSLIMSGASRA